MSNCFSSRCTKYWGFHNVNDSEGWCLSVCCPGTFQALLSLVRIKVTPEFPGQLIASLLVAQWSERWCTSLGAQGLIHGMSCLESVITRGKPQIMLLPPIKFLLTTCLCPILLAWFLARDWYDGVWSFDLWVSVLIWSYRRAMIGSTPEFPSQLIALLLVAQRSERWCTSLLAQGLIPGMPCLESAITRGKTQMMLLPLIKFSWTTCLCPNLLAGFMARDCYEGIQTCDLWVSVLI
jgi:hypothetical protein